MKAIVHIGSPKAGSSSIQDFLFLNAAALSKQGFRFHRNVRGRGSQFEYPMAIMARNGTLLRGEVERARYDASTLEDAARGSEPYLADLSGYAERYKEPVALFSSEHILPWLSTPALIGAMDEAFSAAFDEVRYLVYFRSPASTIVSQYSERIKRGYSFTLDEFIERRLKGLDLFKPARRWANTVGRDRLTVRLFDRSCLKDGDLIADYCDACGIDADGLVTPPIVNEGLTAPAAEALRVLNSMVPEIHPDGSPNPLRGALLEEIMEMSAGMPRLALNSQQRARVDDFLEEGTEKFRRWFFHGRRPLFPETANAPEAMSPEALSDQAQELLARLLIRTRMGEIPTLGPLERRRALITERDQIDDVAAETAPTGRQRTGTGG